MSRLVLSFDLEENTSRFYGVLSSNWQKWWVGVPLNYEISPIYIRKRPVKLRCIANLARSAVCIAWKVRLWVTSKCERDNTIVQHRSTALYTYTARVYFSPHRPGRSSDWKRLLGAVLFGAWNSTRRSDAQWQDHRRWWRLLQHFL